MSEPEPRKRRRRHLRAFALVAALIVGAILALSASAAPVIPVPNPLVKVRTESGNIVRERVIPLGGAPVPLDVDERILGGLLFPDVDVSVGLIAAEELPGKPIVPTIEVNRDPVAILRKAPAPPLRIDFTIELDDAGNGLSDLADVTYGYETPTNGTIPSRFKSKLIGPVEGGFVDPLEAVVETPGYSAPLKVNADVVTPSFEGDFQVGLNPIPERIHFIEDPRDDGLDFAYDHQGPIPDIKLDAAAELTDPESGRVRAVSASVERLPREIKLSNTNTDDSTSVSYEHTSELPKPDLEANYSDVKGDGTVVTDANVKVGGLPAKMQGEVGFADSELDSFDFEVLEGGEIGSLDFLARNYTGDDGNVPARNLGPDQFATVATRQQADGSSRFRAAGRFLSVRSAEFELEEDDNKTVDVTTDVGDGNTPLRVIADLDNRGPGGPADPAERKRLMVDALITPLPRNIHVRFDPSRGPDPTEITYDSDQTVDVDTTAVIADGDETDGCGQAAVTCLQARVDKLAPHLEVSLPGEGGKDFSIAHNAGSGLRPDVRATVDRTPVNPADRTWAQVELLRVPENVTGRLDISQKDVLRAAEFHACDWDFAAAPPGCSDDEGALGRVTFTVRDQPERGDLPPRRDTVPNFVSLISRDPTFATEGDERFEATGRVDEVRHVVFHQRDANDDGEPDGTLGASVEAGIPNQPFDVAVDAEGFFADPEDETKSLGPQTSEVFVRVSELPGSFQACVREQDDVVPPPAPTLLDPLFDPLLADCDRTDVLGRGEDELDNTPLSVGYRASDRTKVTAEVFGSKPDPEDGNRIAVTELDATVDTVPARLRTDVIPPIKPEDGVVGRKLEFGYDANDGDGGTDDTVPEIRFDLATRRANSLCEDPRPERKATCVTGVLKDLPQRVNATFDPDETKGDFVIDTSAPGPGQDQLSINPDPEPDPFRLSTVSPEADSTPLILEARVEDIVPRLEGKIQRLNLDGEGIPVDQVEEGKAPLDDRIATCDDDENNDNQNGTDEDDPDCEPDMARLRLDACPGFDPEDLPDCGGIGRIWFKATNSLVGDPLPPVPAGPGGVTQDFSFVQSGEDFRAMGTINKFKEVELDRLDPMENPSETTKLRAAFGDGDATDKVRAYVDRDTGTEAQKIDAVIAEAPQAVNLCLRGSVHPDDVKAGSEFGFCEKAAQDKTAIETRLDAPAGNDKPDITVSQFKLSKGGGAEVLQGIPGSDPAIEIIDLAEKIEVLAGEEDKAAGKRSDLLVEGKTLGGALANVAGRVSFALQNFEETLGAGFPRDSLTGAIDPEDDPRNDDDAGAPNAGRNYVKVIKAREKLQFEGSIPAIKRIKLDPEPCDPSDPRFPPEADFDPAVRPEYTCVNALVAQDRPLGLAVRTLDEHDEVLALDEGSLDPVPGGGDGLEATLTKSPDAAKQSNVCAQHSDATASGGCRPPFLSLEAPRSEGQAPPVFRARFATGPKQLVEDLRDLATPIPGVNGPIDELSDRLDYEQSPGDYAVPGARLKLGTRGDDTALRGGFRLEVPQFLDLDPPTSYSCKHLVKDELGDCMSDEVSAEANKGFEAKDIAIKLVGSNTGHGNADLDTLGPDGRLALLVHDFDKSKQVILTGAPDADGPSGTTTFTPERGDTGGPRPPAGPYDNGMVIPGYVDARVYMRDDYNPTGSDETQQKFIQVDGRVNHPLTLALRLNEPDTTNRYGENRDGDTVPTTQFTVRNAPCAGRPACGPYANESFNDPSFRIRAEVRGPKKEGKDDRCQGVDEWGAGFGFTACIILPQPDTRWMNVDLNHKPTGADAARTVEAVAATFDNNFDLKAFRNVNDKGTPAKFTPQAALRLAPFEIGFKAGVGIGIVGASTEMFMNGDLILGAAGLANEQLLISNEAGAVRLKSSGGESQINTDLNGFFRTIVTAEALFGLISDTETHTTPTGHIHLEFLECPDFDIPSFIASHDGMSVEDDNVKAGIQLIPNVDQAASPAAAVITGVNALILPIFCLLDTQEDDLVTGNYPAPRWSEPGRPIEDIGDQAPAAGAGDDEFDELPPDKVDITINGTQTMCGTVAAKTLRVSSTGTLRVGPEGETVPAPPPATGNIACDGRLFLEVDNLIVEAGGVIDAAGKRTTAGPGQPGSGLGGGAGHAGTGGPSGSGGPGGGTYGNNSNLTEGFGSHGRDGSSGAAGGLGGGVVRVDAADSIDVAGLITARGGGGAPVAGSDCGLTSAGGGSGGAIHLVANKVNATGTVSATGGPGGTGSNGGGGGGGGRVRIDTVILGGGGTFSNGGGGGGAGGACDAGSSGNPGSVVENELGLAAGVTRDETDPWVQGSVELDLKGVKEGGGDMDIVVCRATVPLGTEDPFNAPGIEPPSVSDTEDLDDSSVCQTESFGGPTSGGDTYERTITINGLGDAYYGFYAFAKEDNIFFDDYQPVPPTKSTVKLGSDSTAPVITDVTRRNGVAGCESDSFCLGVTTGLMRLAANDGNGSGIVDGRCNVNGGGFTITCLPADSVSVNLGGEGLRTVDVQITDRAGNSALASASGKAAKWFVDLKAPDPPVMVLQQQGGEKNGWFKEKPQLSVVAGDPAPSAGFDANAITVLVDEAERTCPSMAPAGSSVSCSSSDTEDFVPENGIHSFRSYVTDRLGHRSNPLRTTCEGSVDPKACTMRVDSKPPTSRLFIGPKKPDGEEDWYTTRPFFAFAASDGPGGSGVDPADDADDAGTGIRWRIDGGSFQDYDPTADEVNRIPEGIHTICWYATDLAGNIEDGGNPNPNPAPGNPANCRSQIKVDETAPIVEAPISPADPNGNNSFWTVKPEVDPQGDDVIPDEPPGLTADDTSKLDRVEYQVDMGPWTPAAPFLVNEGEHEVRVRGFDKAGNPAQLVQRTVRVDISKPTADIASYPPAPNDQGWFRQDRINSIVASDGRDASGEDGATYSIDGAPAISYLGPFAVEHGIHNTRVVARDRAGLLGDPFDQLSRVDTLAPVPKPVGPNPAAVLLPGDKTTLRFNVDGTLGPRVKVIVWLYNELGTPVHHIVVPGPHPGGFRDAGPGQVVWNGRDGRDRGELPGLYHYRVQAIDQAGNSAISTESASFLVLLPGLPV